MEDPPSYVLGVYKTGFTPPLAAIPKGPDQTRVDRRALPSSSDGDGRSANRLPSGVCVYALNGVGCSIVPKPKNGS